MTPLPESTIVDLIMRAAAFNGDPHPTALQYARGTRGELVDFASNDQLDDRAGAAPSVLVVATGNFQVESRGIGRPILHGPSIALVISEETGRATDFTLHRKAPLDLTPLGNVI